MFVQVSVYKEAGTYTVLASTYKECLEKTKTYSYKISNQLLATTIPFETKGQDSSLPNDWRKDLGEEFMTAYYDGQLPKIKPFKGPAPGSIRSKYSYWPL